MGKITVKEFAGTDYGLETVYRLGYQISSSDVGHVQTSSRQQVQATSLRHKKTTLNFCGVDEW